MSERFVNQFKTVLLAEITELNGNITEEELNMAIMENIFEEKLNKAQFEDKNAIVEDVLDGQIDNEEIEKNGAFVYGGSDKCDFFFKKFDTVADAVRCAINKINAKVICAGKIITYDTLDASTAYYVDNRKNKVMIVEL